VTVSVERDRFHIEIVLDPESLLTRLARRAQSSTRAAETPCDRCPWMHRRATSPVGSLRIATRILRELTIQFDEKLAAARLDDVVMLPGVVGRRAISSRLPRRAPPLRSCARSVHAGFSGRTD
jgi:hypothetical protein